MYDDDDRFDLEDRKLGRYIALTVALGVIGAMGFTMLRDEQNRSLRADALAIETTVPPEVITPASAVPLPSTTAGLAPLADPNEQTDAAAPTTTAVAAAPTTAPATTLPPTTTVPPTSAPTTAPPAPGLAYPAAADGSPLPVIVTYDTGKVTLTGAVPSDEARNRLVGLARANSQEADIDVVDNLFVNAAVPASVGVRVIEMNSARFGEGEAQLVPEHTMQFDRVAAVLRALPHVSVLVIGHADQRGGDTRNLELSEDRAGTVVDYLTYLGVEPTRLSMRGAGESDLLTLDDDDSALALNRRTEFVFYGLLL